MSNLKLDNWQEQVLDTPGNIVLRSGRQVGKSTVIAVKAGEFALKKKRSVTMVIASVERQASLLFDKILDYLLTNYKKSVCTGSERPTRHRIQLTNKSVIYCVPAGLSGYGIRGYTIDLLIADEAAFINEDVWQAVTPMIATTKGTLILLSTPYGKDSYFYHRFQDPTFTKFHISSEECDRIPKEFLEQEKKRMTKLQYAQEYQGEFVDELMQFFSNDLIKENMTLDSSDFINTKYKYFLGVDVARYGGDQSTYVVVEKTTNKIINVKECLWSENMSTMHVIGQIKTLHKKYGFTKIYIDDGGIGAPILDFLLEDEETRRVIEGINNSKKSIEHNFENPRARRILKEDLYANLLSLMQHKKINLIKSQDLFMSLSSIQYEYTSEGSVKIFGKYTHICEGLIRAAWCNMDKSLNIWIR